MRGSKSESPLGGEGAQGLEHKPASLKVIAASAKRAAVAERGEGLTAFPIWAGRERQRPGGDKSGRRPTAFCYLIPERQAISIFFVQSLLFCIK